MVAWVYEANFDIDVPVSPRSYISIEPLADKVYKTFRLLSMEICTNSSTSLNTFKNEGINTDKELLEWLIFLHRFPHQLISF